MNYNLSKPRLFMGCSCSLGSGPNSSSQERTMFSPHCLMKWASSCCISLFSMSLQCYLRPLKAQWSQHKAPGSAAHQKPSDSLVAVRKFSFLLLMMLPGSLWQVRGATFHLLGIFNELSAVRPSQYLHFKAWHDKRMKSLGISPLSLNLFIPSCTKVRTNSSNTRHSVQCRNR